MVVVILDKGKGAFKASSWEGVTAGRDILLRKACATFLVYGVSDIQG